MAYSSLHLIAFSVDLLCFINVLKLLWQNVGEKFYTVGEVVHEIRDHATRDWLQTLPYVLQFREPLPDAVKIGSLVVLELCTVILLACNF